MSIVNAVGQLMRGTGEAPGQAILYGGGSFTRTGGEDRNCAAVVSSDPSKNIFQEGIEAWNPNCSGFIGIFTMVLNGADMYLGGGFTTVRGTARNRAACVDSDPTQANPDLRAWNPNCGNIVFAMVLNGGDMYLGGQFTTVRGTTRNHAACVDSDVTQADPDLREWHADCNNTVRSMILNGDDMYLGGDFTTVGLGPTFQPVARNRAACVDSDPTQNLPNVRPWNPNCGNAVWTMLLSGADMYLAGNFTGVRGQTRNRAACVASDSSIADPDLRAWNPNCDDAVRTMILNGVNMYLGGFFLTVRGETRNRAACVASDPDAANPTLRAWHPNCDSTVRTMIFNGADMYLGGNFSTVRGSTRNRLACVDSNPDAASPALRNWNPSSNNDIYAMILSGDYMYLGGRFTTINAKGGDRAFAAPFLPNASEDVLLPWNPECNSDVHSMLLNGDDMYLGGDFTTVRGITRTRLACVESDPYTVQPALRNWNPNCNDRVRSILIVGEDLYIGGSFSIIRGETRNCAACVDSDPTQSNPDLRNWNPNCSGGVIVTMILDGENMYLGGTFTSVRGQTRNRLACVDIDSSQTNPDLRAWNPNCGGVVWSMLLNGDDMYLAGGFTSVRGQTRNRLACVDSDPDAADPDLRAWNPNCNNTVYMLVLNGDDMYIGGMFSNIRGTTRYRVACVASDPDAANPDLRDWNPNTDHLVRSMVLRESEMYILGQFTTVSGGNRSYAACVDSDPTTNFLFDYDLNLNDVVLVTTVREGGS